MWVKSHHRIVSKWLVACALAVLVMIVLGGITRLTGSGLSIVEWRLITGIFPPLDALSWQSEFAKYQLHSEFQQVNTYMSLADFKQIYWLEYVHRLWGRVLGVIVLIPLIVFAWRQWISRKLILSVLTLFALGGVQGIVGWYMVKSGLGADPQVSPYRLTGHLIIACIIFLGFFWLSLTAKVAEVQNRTPLFNPYKWLLGFGIVLVTYGGLVAGHKAGLIYNTFPLMGGKWMPGEAWDLTPTWLNILSNAATVQWIHRWLAIIFLTVVMIIVVSRILRKQLVSSWEKGLLGMVVVQVGLGVSVLIHHVPVIMAAAHQLFAMIILMKLVGAAFYYQRSVA